MSIALRELLNFSIARIMVKISERLVRHINLETIETTYRSLESTCFNGCYCELVELIGHENMFKMYKKYSGQYLSFPKKLLTDEYVHEMLLAEYDGGNGKILARKYGYTYSWVMKMIKASKN